jgi:hypothetical protein
VGLRERNGLAHFLQGPQDIFARGQKWERKSRARAERAGTTFRKRLKQAPPLEVRP